jgi:DNA-binding transcriptional MocR family regulator
MSLYREQPCGTFLSLKPSRRFSLEQACTRPTPAGRSYPATFERIRRCLLPTGPLIFAPEGAYQVLARANQMEAMGREIIHFEIGQPDYATFENVSQAGINAIRSGKTRYTPPAGMPSLRAAIAADAGMRRGIEVQPDEVVVSPGGKPNLFFPTLGAG